MINKLVIVLFSLTLVNCGDNSNPPRPPSRPLPNKPLPDSGTPCVDSSGPSPDTPKSYGKFNRPLPDSGSSVATTRQPKPNSSQRPLEIDEDRIRAFGDTWCQYFDQGDIDTLMSFYAEDAVLLVYGRQLQKKETRKVIEQLLNDNFEPCGEEIDVISGDYFYPYLTGFVMTSKNGAPTMARVFSEVLRLRDDGEYEIVLQTVSFTEQKNNIPNSLNPRAKSKPKNSSPQQDSSSDK